MNSTHYSTTAHWLNEPDLNFQQAGTSKVNLESHSQSSTDFDRYVSRVLDEVGQLLSEKNKLYGNAYFEPIGVFSKLSAVERIDARIDEKLARIKSGQKDDQEDTINDLIGLLVIRKMI